MQDWRGSACLADGNCGGSGEDRRNFQLKAADNHQQLILFHSWKAHYHLESWRVFPLVTISASAYFSWPVETVVAEINPVLRGWVNYFRGGHSSICFGVVKCWVEEKVRRHLLRARGRKRFGWTRWNGEWLYDRLGLFNNYQLRRW